MSKFTKQALRTSLKKLMKEKPVDKITIGELAQDCGISRMTFYYHFKDIYDLLEWTCIEDLNERIQEKPAYSTWEEGLLRIFEVTYEYKVYVTKLNHSISHEGIETFWLERTRSLIRDAAEKEAAGTDISPAQLDFIADFYKYSITGILIEWFDQGMKADYEKIVSRISVMMRGNLSNSIRNLSITPE